MLFGLGVATEGQAEILVSPKYAHIERFSEGLAAFTYDFAKYGFIDEEGNEVIEPCFYMPEDEVMMLFEDGLCRVYTDDGTDAMINHEGKVVEILN